MEFDQERSQGGETEEGDRLVGRKRAAAEGEEEELEVGQPGNKESGYAGEMQRMEGEREEEQDSDDRYDSEEPSFSLGDDVGYRVTVRKRGRMRDIP